MTGMVRLIWIATAIIVATGGALAQTPAYPAKGIRIVVPFPPGGPNDFFGRTLANKLGQMTGQPVVVDNRSGAAGVTGTEYVAKSAPPDGYTLVLTTAGALVIVPAISDVMPYDPVRDLAPITVVAQVPEILVAIPRLGLKSLAELVAYAKANPGKINFASAGSGGLPHLAGEMLKRDAGIDIVHIPYRGAAPAVNDLLGGHVEIMFADVPVLIAHIEAGTLIGLAIGSAARAPTLPNIPTTTELGFPNIRADNWYALLAPAATPPEIQATLSRLVMTALREPDVQQAFAKQGALAVGNTPAEFAAFLRTEADKWGPLAKAVGAKID